MRGLAICYVNVYFGLEAVGNQQPDLVLPLVAKIGFATGIVKMPEISSANRQSSARQRSAVTNNRRLFVAGDDRSAWSRRYRDLIVAHTSDLGGAAALSEAQRSLVRRAAGLECELEQMEGRMSQGMEVNLDAFGRAASHLRRIFEVLGVERRARSVTVDGVEVEVFSPMRARWAAEAEAEAAAAAKQGATE